MKFCSNRIKPIHRALVTAVLLTGTPAFAQQVLLGQPEDVQGNNEPVTVDPGSAYDGDGGFSTDIGSSSLEAPSAEAAGLQGAAALGLTQDMWGGTDGATAIALIQEAAPSGLYTVNRLVRKTLVAGATPPENATGMLARRADALVRFGAAEDASSLVSAAGNNLDDDLRRSRAEAALIVGRDEVLCGKDMLEPGSPADEDGFWTTLRGYCLAQTGDKLAPVAISAMLELGNINSLDAPLLEALVDESLVDYVSVPHASALTPMRIAMLRSLGRANYQIVESAPLPMIAGLFALESTGAKGALLAAERLEAVGAIETNVLREMYVSLANEVDATPVAARAKAVRDAEKTPDAKAMGDALIAAARAKGVGGFAQLGRVLAPAAAKLQPGAAADMGAKGYALRDAMLMGGFTREAGAWSDAQGAKSLVEQADVAAVMAVADPGWPGTWRREYGDALRARARDGDEHARRSLAALAGFDIALKPKLPDEGALKAAREGRIAEAVLLASADMAKETPVSAKTLDTTIRVLRSVGLENDARGIAVEAMITARWR